MKVERKTITVKIGPDGDEAVFVFQRLKSNTHARIMHDLKEVKDSTDTFQQYEAMSKYHAAVLDSCVEVQNLFEDDAEITLDQVRRGELYPETVALVLQGYFAAIEVLGNREQAAAKKTEPPSSGG